MEQEKIERINALARLAKTRELTPEEQDERRALRQEYLEDWRRGTEAVLAHTSIQMPDGRIVKLKKKEG